MQGQFRAWKEDDVQRKQRNAFRPHGSQTKSYQSACPPVMHPACSSLCGKKSKDLAHQVFPLIRLEEVLRMRGAIQDDQLLWLRSLLVLFPNPGKTRSV